MKPGAHVILRDKDAEFWRGPLRALLRDNDMGRESARGIVAQLRRYGNALIGGGASGEFTIECENGGAS